MEIIYKKIGETPLEALERFRRSRVEEAVGARSKQELRDIPMTYAGRLDPMAEGKLIILVGDECKNKEKYLALDKEYEVEVLFGISTDTGDVMGIVGEVQPPDLEVRLHLAKYVGKFTQAYPPYSSKTVNGKQLHELARAGELPDEMPEKEVEIYSIEDLGSRHMAGKEIAEHNITRIGLVQGDFRQEEVIAGWRKFQEKFGARLFTIMKIKVKCSSGTYMRSLAERMGNDIGVGALALSIKRTDIIGIC